MLSPEQIEQYRAKYGINQDIEQEQRPGYFERVGSQMQSQFGEAVESQTASMEGRMNPLSAGANIAKNVTGIIASPLTQALAPVMEPIQKNVVDPIVQSKIGEKATDWMAKKIPEPVLGATSDTLETFLNMMAVEGMGKTVEAAPRAFSKLKGKMAGGGPGKGSPIVAGTGRILQRAGEGSYSVTVVPKEGGIRAMQTYQSKTPNVLTRIKNTFTGQTEGRPITPANTAARYGIVGTEKGLGIKAQAVARDLWKGKVAPELAKVKGAVDMKSFIKELQKDVNKIGDLSRRSSLQKALDTFAEDYAHVGKIGLEKLQSYKEGWGKFLPEKTYKTGEPISTAFKEVQNMARRKATGIIYKHLGEAGKKNYIDYGNFKTIMEDAIKAGGDPAKKSLSRGAWQFVMDKAITPTVTVAGKVLYKTGEGLEFWGRPGAKTVGDVMKAKPSPPQPLLPEKLSGKSLSQSSIKAPINQDTLQVLRTSIDAVVKAVKGRDLPKSQARAVIKETVKSQLSGHGYPELATKIDSLNFASAKSVSQITSMIERTLGIKLPKSLGEADFARIKNFYKGGNKTSNK